MGESNGRRPRLVHDLFGNVLLVRRICLCYQNSQDIWYNSGSLKRVTQEYKRIISNAIVSKKWML